MKDLTNTYWKEVFDTVNKDIIYYKVIKKDTEQRFTLTSVGTTWIVEYFGTQIIDWACEDAILEDTQITEQEFLLATMIK
jgi:hypothetical protein